MILWLKRRADDAEMISIKLICLLPVHVIRIGILRLWGAKLSPGVTVYRGLEVRRARRLSIGRNTSIGNDAILDARGGLSIGDHVNLSTGVHIWTAQHDWRAPDFAFVSAAVSIESHAWLSARTTILPGVTVGEASVVAAGAVVSRSVLPYIVVGGVPAKKITERPRPMSYELSGSQGKSWWW
jgi:acetyltransferase-like isoleucine patch superfamily enzyme